MLDRLRPAPGNELALDRRAHGRLTASGLQFDEEVGSICGSPAICVIWLQRSKCWMIHCPRVGLLYRLRCSVVLRFPRECGRAPFRSTNTNGVSGVDLVGLSVQKAIVSLDGASSASINASNSLDYDLNGLSRLRAYPNN